LCVYLNGQPHLTAVLIKLYADDIQLYSCRVITLPLLLAIFLSVAVSHLYKWKIALQKNVLLVVYATTDLMLNHKSILYLSINNVVLPAIDSVRDFGIIVDQHLKFDVGPDVSLAVRKAMLRSRLILKDFPPTIKFTVESFHQVCQTHTWRYPAEPTAVHIDRRHFVSTKTVGLI